VACASGCRSLAVFFAFATMDQRLPNRIKEVRQKLSAAGKSGSSAAIQEELVKTYSEYGRAKQQALKRIIAQALSTPLPAAVPLTADDAASANRGDAANGPARKKRRKAAALEAVAAQDAVFSSSAPDVAEKLEAPPSVGRTPVDGQVALPDLNSSLRKMYNPQAAEAAEQAESAAEARASRLQAAKERKAMARARRDAGLPEPHGGSGSSKPAFEPTERPEERLEDLGGIDSILADLRMLVVHPLSHPEVYIHLGVQAPTGVLLHGPPGSGKTKLAHALAGTTGVTFFKVAATEIVSGMSGESEKKLRELFQAAIAAAPSLLFMDEVDSITPRRDSAGREMERRIVAQLLTCMDELQNQRVLVMGATNRPDALDPALRRAGRFDREIAMGIPDLAARAKILEKMVSGMRIDGDLDLDELARLTPGFVGADLSALTKEAAMTAVTRAFSDLEAAKRSDAKVDDDETPTAYTSEELAPLAIGWEDFKVALTKVQPSARREGFSTIPDVSFEDIGALADTREELDAAVCEPIRKHALFKQLGLTVPVGVLLFGPPGCGKTLLAKATANASGANFISIKGPELLNKYVGESERAVRLVFQRAANSAPCVIFFDELDSLVPRRSGEGGSGAERVVNQMLTEMDGVNDRAQVYVIAATNRPDIVDPAMLRPGRLDKMLFVPLPSEAGRLEILRAHTKRMPLADDVDLETIAREAEGFSGADLAGLVREAAMIAIRATNVPDPTKPASKAAGDAAPKETEPPETVETPPAAAEPVVAEDAAVDAPKVEAEAVNDVDSKMDTTGAVVADGPAVAEEAAQPEAPSVLITGAIFAKARSKTSPSVGDQDRKEYEALRKKYTSGL